MRDPIPALNVLDQRPLPFTEDRDTAGFFEAARRQELAIRFCVDCGEALHLPKAYCHECGGWNTEWRVVSPAGTLYTFTVTERQLRAGFAPPYAVVIVELDDAPGVRLAGYLEGRPPLQIGMRMRAEFIKSRDGVVLPQWQPTMEEPRNDREDRSLGNVARH